MGENTQCFAFVIFTLKFTDKIFIEKMDMETGESQKLIHLERLANIAQKNGSAIGIGHVRKNTLEILTKKLSV